MKNPWLVSMSLLAASSAFAVDHPRPVMGLPATQPTNPCEVAVSDDAAKALLSRFETFYRDQMSQKKAPTPRKGTDAPIVSACNPRQLRQAAGEPPVMGFPARDVCGVKYTFESAKDEKAFAKWAYKAIRSKLFELQGSAICTVTQVPGPVGMPVNPR